MNHMYYNLSGICSPAALEKTIGITLSRQDLVEKLNISHGCLSKHWSDAFTETYIECYIDGTPSQCGMVILYSWGVAGNFEEKFPEFWKDVVDMLKVMNYSKVMVTMTNKQPYKMLENAGFDIVDTFTNRRSGNINFILTFKVPE